MTPEVKQRIEQIQQGIVPKGYKKTKSDIVPVDWKESPIGKYIREYTEKTTIPNQYPVLTSARTGLMLQTDYYSNRQVTTEDNVGYNILPYGYITFRSRSDDGRFRFNENRIIERGVISYFYPVFSFSEEACHEYMLYLLNFSIYRRMYPYAEGTAQQVLSLKKLGQLKYSLPLVAEQKKIAEILATQDKAIELQGRKIEELKRFKKGCLEKMFPRKGQKVPEKRFPGFTDDWEQRKLGEVFNFHYGDGNNNPSNGGQYPVFGAGGIQGRYTKYNAENSIIIGHMGDAGCVSWGEGKHFVTYNGTITTPKDDVFTAKFGYYLLLNMNLRKYRGGSGLPFLTYDMLTEMETKCPNSKIETQEIADYFTQLDRLIALHQCKLEEMKRQKKALMQLLLTGIVRVRL